MRIQRPLAYGLATSSLLAAHGFVIHTVPSGRALMHSGSRPKTRPLYYDITPRPVSDSNSIFKYADPIQIEVISFGPMGASVDVVGRGHNPNNLIPDNVPSLGQGLILQKEIHYFRQERRNVDVVKGEVLPAYVEEVRDDGRLNISLRTPGGKAKAEKTSVLIMDLLKKSPDGILSLGDKSSPYEIGTYLPGVSKLAFKKAVAALYKEGLVKPGPSSISLMGGSDLGEQTVKSTVKRIVEELEKAPRGTLPLGYESTAEDVGARLPGILLVHFTKAIAALTKNGKVKSGRRSTRLCDENASREMTAASVSKLVMEKLDKAPDGTLPLGYESPTEEIVAVLPGVSRVQFNKAIAALTKEGKVKKERRLLTRLNATMAETAVSARPTDKGTLRESGDMSQSETPSAATLMDKGASRHRNAK